MPLHILDVFVKVVSSLLTYRTDRRQVIVTASAPLGTARNVPGKVKSKGRTLRGILPRTLDDTIHSS